MWVLWVMICQENSNLFNLNVEKMSFKTWFLDPRTRETKTLHYFSKCIPQILRGASSSSRIGWLRKISLDLRHKPRTSASVICTGFPGRHPRTETNKPVWLPIVLMDDVTSELTPRKTQKFFPHITFFICSLKRQNMTQFWPEVWCPDSAFDSRNGSGSLW